MSTRDDTISATATSTEASSLQLDHLGVIAPDLDAARCFLERALSITRWTEVTSDPVLRVAVQFGTAEEGGLVYELIAPLGEESPISNALRSGKHILNHVAYLSADLTSSGEHLRTEGCWQAGPPLPALAYGGALVQFWISPLRFVIELIEKPGHRHAFAEPKVL
jgi:methylmalonyl-CoA/ethylmalonyl-CoA epimerase